MRLHPLNVSLRSKRLFAAFKKSARKARDFGLRINEFTLMGNHLHLIAEADETRALTLGMRSFGGRFGKLIRAAAGGTGAVFRDRFHAHVLKTPTEYKNALRYVLLNHAKHQGCAPNIDGFSSAKHFTHWNHLVNATHARRLARWCVSEPASYLAAARSWLGRLGWRLNARSA